MHLPMPLLWANQISLPVQQPRIPFLDMQAYTQYLNQPSPTSHSYKLDTMVLPGAKDLATGILYRSPHTSWCLHSSLPNSNNWLPSGTYFLDLYACNLHAVPSEFWIIFQESQ